MSVIAKDKAQIYIFLLVNYITKGESTFAKIDTNKREEKHAR